VERILPPLIDYDAVLVKTKDSVLWLRHTILFQDYNIRTNNFGSDILKVKCLYHPQKDPYCPKFLLSDIIDYTPNAEMKYNQMAKFGGFIVISIEWNCSIKGFLCFFRKNDSSLYDCTPHYSFTRVDNMPHRPYTGNTSYVHAHYLGNMRTHYRSFRIRIVVRVTGTVSECNLYELAHEMVAMYGVFCAIIVLYQLYITLYKYKSYKFDETIQVNEGKSFTIQDTNEYDPLITDI